MNAISVPVIDDACHDEIKSNAISCPTCGEHFAPCRSNQHYCSRSCQKKSTNNAARGDRKVENRAQGILEGARARDLQEMLYSAPPSERLGLMKVILDSVPTDSVLCHILTSSELLSRSPVSFGRGQMNIAKAADAYTRKFFGMSIRAFVEKVQAGTILLGVEVTSKVDRGPVPKLRRKLTKKSVKCIHAPLPDVSKDATEALEEDHKRVSQIVQAVTVRIAALPLIESDLVIDAVAA